MDSIIEKIKETEAEAEAMKREAAGKAREAIAAAGEEAQRLVAQAREQGFEELVKVKAGAETQGRQIAERIRSEKAAEADAVCAEARGRTDRAVSYLLERVKQA
ncbi:MAG: hypothetical protein PHO41_02565 [Eubacteriales bacterium]|nr:hypothetical protein [Eubacteriales bacterium]